MNHISCSMTKCKSLTPNILPAITELIPMGVNHMTHVTIFMMTSKTAVKKSTTICPFSPIVPNMVPKTRQKKTMPSVLVPLRYCTTRMSAGSSTSPPCCCCACISSVGSNSVPIAVSLSVSLKVCKIFGLGR